MFKNYAEFIKNFTCEICGSSSIGLEGPGTIDENLITEPESFCYYGREIDIHTNKYKIDYSKVDDYEGYEGYEGYNSNKVFRTKGAPPPEIYFSCLNCQRFNINTYFYYDYENLIGKDYFGMKDFISTIEISGTKYSYDNYLLVQEIFSTTLYKDLNRIFHISPKIDIDSNNLPGTIENLEMLSMFT